MTAYRLYCLDGAGKINFAEWIEADTDAEAVDQAREKKSGALKCEIWNGARLVAALSSDDLAS